MLQFNVKILSPTGAPLAEHFFTVESRAEWGFVLYQAGLLEGAEYGDQVRLYGILRDANGELGSGFLPVCIPELTAIVDGWFNLED